MVDSRTLRFKKGQNNQWLVGAEVAAPMVPFGQLLSHFDVRRVSESRILERLFLVEKEHSYAK